MISKQARDKLRFTINFIRNYKIFLLLCFLCFFWTIYNIPRTHCARTILPPQDEFAFDKYLEYLDKKPSSLNRTDLITLWNMCPTCKGKTNFYERGYLNELLWMHSGWEDRKMMHSIVLPNVTHYLREHYCNIRVLNIGVSPYVVWLEPWFDLHGIKYHTLEQNVEMDNWVRRETHYHNFEEISNENFECVIAYGIWNYGTTKEREKDVLNEIHQKLKSNGILVVFYNSHYAKTNEMNFHGLFAPLRNKWFESFTLFVDGNYDGTFDILYKL